MRINSSFAGRVLPAAPPLNVYTDSLDTAACLFYRVGVLGLE